MLGLTGPSRCLGRSFRSIFRRIAHCAPYPPRTHTCGVLTAGDAGSQVVLAGWLLSGRKGQIVSFFPLKDSSGTTQLVVRNGGPCLFDVPVESTVLVEGTVLLRPESARRPGPAGEIEVEVEKFILLNPAATDMPFLPSDTRNLANEELRARHRYLDLRRSALSDNLKKRSHVAHIVRNVLHQQGFLEVETPMLLKSTPEGAREFLVPTRTTAATHPLEGPLFYALPQSPQQPKQLLICSGGVDKYFQLAKCFRDEDGRKDRQPEFTQVDLEMAFVSWGDVTRSSASNSDGWKIGGREVRDVVESLIRTIWKEVEGVQLPGRFDVMSYHDAMKTYGSDKPDTRFGLQISDISHLLPHAHRSVFDGVGDSLECLIVHLSSDAAFGRVARNCDSDPAVERICLTEQNMLTWLLSCKLLYDKLPDVTEPHDHRINEALGLNPGDIVWLARRPRVPQGGSTALGRLRLLLAERAQSRGNLRLPDAPHFLWVTEFPLFTRADKEKDFLAQGRWSSSHHPFTAPMWQDVHAMYDGDIASVRGQHYDLVLNGVEIGGGSVRVHDAEMQEYIFSKVLQLNKKEEAAFSHLLQALRCGAPPHGGMALGFDRLMAIICKTQSIRDVIAFPKTSVGTDLQFKSPAAVSREVLEQYNLQPR